MSTIKNKFFKKLESDGDCLIFTGSGRGKGGYGRINYQDNGKTKSISAHRLAYLMLYGEIPAGAVIRHTCHRPSCVNPAHLVAGTPAQNSQDMVEAGRSLHRYGASNPNSKLTNSQREEIRALKAEGRTLKEIAAMFGVHFSTVSVICRKKRPRE